MIAQLALLAAPLAFPQEGLHSFDSVHVAFAEEHSSAIVSGFGHVFVCLPSRPVESASDLLHAPAVNFGADTSPLGKGMWIGEYKIQTTHQLLRRNTQFEDRTVTFLEIQTTAEQRTDLRHRLEKRLDGEYPYDFARLNCGHYILDWLGVQNQSWVRHLYLTPRESINLILDSYPPIAKRSFLSGTALLSAYVRDSLEVDGSTRIHHEELQSAIDDDLVAKLLWLRIQLHRESTAGHRVARESLSALLATQDGADAAARLVRFEESLFRPSTPEWSRGEEGPAVRLGLVRRASSPSIGGLVHFEAGLRDWFSQPRSDHVLRTTQFLSARVIEADGSTTADLVLAQLDTERDFNHLDRRLSNGLKLGYSGIPNDGGLEGAYASAWGGASLGLAESWIGARITASVVELQDHARLQVGPSISFHHSVRGFATSGIASWNSNSQFGWTAAISLIFADGVSIEVRSTSPAEGYSRLEAGIQLRF